MKIEVFINWPASPPAWLVPYLAAITRIDRTMADESATLAALTAEVANNTTVEQSAATLLANLKTELDAAIASSGTDNNAALQALSNTLGNNDTALATAITANTPAP